jgi:hypothetical protein
MHASIDTTSLAYRRQAAAERAFLAYDFKFLVLEGSGGWEFATPGREMTRAIFLAPLDESVEATDRAFFTVRFTVEQSAEVCAVYAINEHGQLLGARGAS